MAVAAEEMLEIEKVLGGIASGDDPVSELRRRFPQLFWTRCSASDMTEAPYRTCAQFEIHLLDRSDHCVQITDDPARATGIVLADRGVSS